MALSITWNRVAAYAGVYQDAVTAGICNTGGRLVMIAGSSAGAITGDVYYSDNNGLTWLKGSGLAIFSGLGIGGNTPSDKVSGLLVYKPGRWIHPEDGDGFVLFGGSGDAGGVLRSHEGDVGAGFPIFNFEGWTTWGQPCLTRRKDSGENKFAVWPGEFIYWAFGAQPTGPLLLELTQAGATSLTTAFLLHQLDPSGYPFVTGTYPDGSTQYIWVTTPPRITGNGGTFITPSGAATAGEALFLVATQDGVIWRVHGPNNLGLNGRGDSGYNAFTQAFFCSDGTLLCGVNVSGLSPCIFRSTDRGVTFTEIVLPGNFFNYVPQGAKGAFIFSGLFVMTHCFCELDDGTILCAGGAPTAISDPLNTGGEPAYHYPVVWRSTDKGITWENISLNVADFGTRLPNEDSELWEGRILLSLGGQAALLVTHIDAITSSDWTPFYITEDGGDSFQKSMAPRVGVMAGVDGALSRPFFYPVQATFANDGSILVVFADWGFGSTANVEIWRGTMSEAPAQLEHRAVGFVESKDIGSPGGSFVEASIPPQELLRG